MLGHNLSRARPVLPGTSVPAGSAMPPARIRRRQPSSPSYGLNSDGWVLEFERSTPETLDPLTGWVVCTDPLSQIQIAFPDLQSAIAFAERKGWRYVVSESGAVRPRPRYPPHASTAALPR